MRVARPKSGLRGQGFLARWAATLALVAVLVQALASGAMAHTAGDQGRALVICSAEGATTITLGADGKAKVEKADAGKLKGQASGLPCQDCVAAATAATPAPCPVVLPVRYAHKVQAWGVVATTIQHHARAPPRPPSRAPPTT